MLKIYFIILLTLSSSLFSQEEKKITIFISYAWHNPNYLCSNPHHELWVEQFANRLSKEGFTVLYDRWCVHKGQNVVAFLEQIVAPSTDYILVIGTKLYLAKSQRTAQKPEEKEHLVKVECRLINYLVSYNEWQNNKVIPILLEGTPLESLPPMLHHKNIVDFVNNDYESELKELIKDLKEGRKYATQ